MGAFFKDQFWCDSPGPQPLYFRGAIDWVCLDSAPPQNSSVCPAKASTNVAHRPSRGGATSREISPEWFLGRQPTGTATPRLREGRSRAGTCNERLQVMGQPHSFLCGRRIAGGQNKGKVGVCCWCVCSRRSRLLEAGKGIFKGTERGDACRQWGRTGPARTPLRLCPPVPAAFCAENVHRQPRAREVMDALTLL